MIGVEWHFGVAFSGQNNIFFIYDRRGTEELPTEMPSVSHFVLYIIFRLYSKPTRVCCNVPALVWVEVG